MEKIVNNPLIKTISFNLNRIDENSFVFTFKGMVEYYRILTFVAGVPCLSEDLFEKPEIEIDPISRYMYTEPVTFLAYPDDKEIKLKR